MSVSKKRTPWSSSLQSGVAQLTAVGCGPGHLQPCGLQSPASEKGGSYSWLGVCHQTKGPLPKVKSGPGDTVPLRLCSLWMWNSDLSEVLLGQPPRTDISCFLMCGFTGSAFPHHTLITFGIVMCRFSSLPLGGYLCLSGLGKRGQQRKSTHETRWPGCCEREPAAVFDLTHMVFLISVNLS